MKKSLLLATMAVSTLSLSAQNLTGGSELFSLTYKGENVENGGKIICSTPIDNYSYDGLDFCDFDVEAIMTNKTGEDKNLYATLTALSPDFQTFKNTLREGSYWALLYGTAQLCAGVNCYGPGAGNFGSGKPTIKANQKDFEWLIHYVEATPGTGCIVRLNIWNTVEDDVETDPYFFVDILFGNIDASVNSVEINENEPIEYFDLQGRRVENPTKGLYILRQGNKSVKRVVR